MVLIFSVNVFYHKMILSYGKSSSKPLGHIFERYLCSQENIDLKNSRIFLEYQNRLKTKQIHDDAHQTAVVQRLILLDKELEKYQPETSSKNVFSSLTSIFKSKSTSDNKANYEPRCRGLYLHGSVGCGKTMLMDLFFENCSVDPRSRRRVHFHSFMLDFHQRFHQLKQLPKNTSSSRASFDFDPVPAIAEEIVNESWLLCLDEFQVTDIGDAMILKNFFQHLFAKGMVLIATSNRAPDELYKSGLQRSTFLPFIPLLKKHCDVYELKSGIDYRRLVDSKKHQVYFIKDETTDKTLDLMFKVMAQSENDYTRAKTLTIKGRNVTLKRACGGLLDSSFDELCDQPLGAIDYLTMAQCFHTIIIRNVPQMTLKLRGQARRFITMIDTFYDNNTRVIISAAVACDLLFQVQKIDNILIDDENRKLMDDLGLKMGSNDSNASIFSGEEEMFAFERALSRLYEMQTTEYWNRKKF